MIPYLFLMSLPCSAVSAREAPSLSAPAEQGPADPGLGWNFSITPRFAYRVFVGQGATIAPESANFQQVTLDLGSDLELGATFVIARPRARGEFVVSVLAMPTTSGIFETILLSPIPFLAIGEASSDRLDVEVLYRRPVRDTDAYWAAGFEYIGMNIQRTAEGTIFEVLESETQARSYLAKGGVGGSLELSRNGRHRLTTDLMAVVGYRSDKVEFTNLALTQTDSNGTLGFDIGAGYAFRIRPATTFNVRYRVQGGLVSTRTSVNGTADSDLQLLTGIEFSVTIPF
jgi:hypothetical protein